MPSDSRTWPSAPLPSRLYVVAALTASWIAAVSSFPNSTPAPLTVIVAGTESVTCEALVYPVMVANR